MICSVDLFMDPFGGLKIQNLYQATINKDLQRHTNLNKRDTILLHPDLPKVSMWTRSKEFLAALYSRMQILPESVPTTT